MTWLIKLRYNDNTFNIIWIFVHLILICVIYEKRINFIVFFKAGVRIYIFITIRSASTIKSLCYSTTILHNSFNTTQKNSNYKQYVEKMSSSLFTADHNNKTYKRWAEQSSSDVEERRTARIDGGHFQISHAKKSTCKIQNIHKFST